MVPFKEIVSDTPGIGPAVIPIVRAQSFDRLRREVDLRGPHVRLDIGDPPHSRQYGRTAIGELSYQSGSWLHSTLAWFTLVKAIETDPVERWHMRQWQR